MPVPRHHGSLSCPTPTSPFTTKACSVFKGRRRAAAGRKLRTGGICRRRRRREETADGAALASRLSSVGETARFVCAIMSCVEGEGSGKATMVAAKEKSSSFAVTCGLLSRFLRENKGGALQGLAGLDMAPPATTVGGGAFQPPTTMNLLSGLEEPKPNTVDAELSVDKGLLLKAPTGNQDAENTREPAAGEEHAEQLTIFYGGKVVVVDSFPSTQVKALLQMVNAVDKAGSTSSSAIPQSLPRPAHGSLPADLPIARRNSLHRFLEKRKGRITAKAPYQANTSSAAPSKQANGDNSWLGLGQEVTIKHEI